MDFIVNEFAPSGILAWIRTWLYRGAQAIDILLICLIFSSLDGTTAVQRRKGVTAMLTHSSYAFLPLDGRPAVYA